MAKFTRNESIAKIDGTQIISFIVPPHFLKKKSEGEADYNESQSDSVQPLAESLEARAQEVANNPNEPDAMKDASDQLEYAFNWYRDNPGKEPSEEIDPMQGAADALEAALNEQLRIKE